MQGKLWFVLLLRVVSLNITIRRLRIISWTFFVLISFAWIMRWDHALLGHHTHCHAAESGSSCPDDDDDCGLCKWIVSPFIPSDVLSLDLAIAGVRASVTEYTGPLFNGSYTGLHGARGPPDQV